MRKSVWKYPFDVIKNPNTFNMPRNAKILCIKVQNNIPTIWALVDSIVDGQIVEFENRTFDIYGTGWNFHEETIKSYIGTFFDGSMVFHVFELIGKN
jgi:hypothetical protein